MDSTSNNGNPPTSRQALDAMRQALENLEADLAKQQAEASKLRAERDEYRKMLVEQFKSQFGGPEEWDNFDPKDYTLNIDDLLAIINSK